MFPSESMVGQNGVPLGGFGCNISFQVDGKRVELKMANINVLVKKYVDNVYHLKTNEDELYYIVIISLGYHFKISPYSSRITRSFSTRFIKDFIMTYGV